MVAPLRLGIVGLGWVARDYMLPAIAAAGDRVRLTAALSLRETDLADLPPSVARFTSFDRFLTAADVDAVYIATPNHLHHDQCVACLAAGWHVLCEKPLGLNVGEVAAMRAAARDYDRLLVTAYDQRHHPAHRTLREWIRGGRLGTPTQVRIDYACWLPREWSGDNWRIDRARAGGGAIIDLAPHGLDLLEWLLDDPIEAVHCYQQTRVQTYEVDDGGVLSLRFRSGTLGSLTVSYNRPETLPRRRLELIGTGGLLVATNTMGQDAGGQLTFTDAADGRTQTIDFDAATGPFDDQLVAFLDRCAAASTSGDSAVVSRALDDLRTTERQVRLLDEALAATTHLSVQN